MTEKKAGTSEGRGVFGECDATYAMAPSYTNRTFKWGKCENKKEIIVNAGYSP